MVMIVSREFVLIIALTDWLMSFSKGRIDWGYSSSNFGWNNLLTFWSNSGLPEALSPETGGLRPKNILTSAIYI